MIGNHLPKGWSKTQTRVALSSGESELYATLKVASEGQLKHFGKLAMDMVRLSQPARQPAASQQPGRGLEALANGGQRGVFERFFEPKWAKAFANAGFVGRCGGFELLQGARGFKVSRSGS